MARYQIVIAYDGTEFLGFQRQVNRPQAHTVQSVLETALRRLGWEGRVILAAGRTDAGVHAAGQVVAFDLDWRHPPQALQDALNANLPPAVAVCRAWVARPDFHPRYDALARRYRYRIYCQAARDPLRERFAWRVWPEIQGDRLFEAASYLPGTHDFAAFGTPPRAGGSTIRIVYQDVWQQNNGEWTFEILANAFLYHMVRRLVACQVQIGMGRLEPAFISEKLSGSLDKPVLGLAPAHGLALVEVLYAEDVASRQITLE